MNLLLHISVYICNMAMTRQRWSGSSTNFVSGSGVSDQGRLGLTDTDMCNIVIDGGFESSYRLYPRDVRQDQD